MTTWIPKVSARKGLANISHYCQTQVRKIERKTDAWKFLYYRIMICRQKEQMKKNNLPFVTNGTSQKFFPHLQSGCKAEQFVYVLKTVDIHCRRTLSAGMA